MRRLALLLVLFLAGVAVALAAVAIWGSNPNNPVGGPSSSPGPESSSSPGGTGKPGKDPFGVLIASRSIEVQQQIQIAKDLGVRYVRPTFPVFTLSPDLACDDCEAFTKAGFDLVLNVRNSSDVRSQLGTQQAIPPSTPPEDLDAYRQTIEKVIDKYHPTILVVENEEDVINHYSGTPEQYGEQLKAACEAAHDKGIKCANGGLLGGDVTWAVYQHYLDAGQQDKAQSFADRAFEDFQRRRLTQNGGAAAQQAAQRVDQFLQAYKGSGADYVNFHWYISDPDALAEATQFLTEATGLPYMTNEIGQRNEDPNATKQILQELVNLRFPVAVWYLSDATLARGLVNPDGSLRPTGDAFRDFVRTRY